ncbi:MAG: response regulator [Candidatus Krumholzibacteriota bacterium]
MIPGQPKILIIDESLQDLRIHATTLRNQGYEVFCAQSSEETFMLLETLLPDLFLIDTAMENTDGYELCRRLKQESLWRNIPVIFITDSRLPEDIDQGYVSGGMDYIVKPCHLSEFLSRVCTQIKLYQLIRLNEEVQATAIDANPLTRLPGNNSIQKAIQGAIDENRDVGIIHTDLDNFKAFNDAYGFITGDDLLIFNAEILHTALRKICAGQGFLGHIGGDDFVVMLPADKLMDFGNEVIRSFDEGAPSFYSDEDRVRGQIVSVDRQGRIKNFPITSISMGGMYLRDYWFSRYVEVAEICAEVKHKAKSIIGSKIFVDRREADPPPLGQPVGVSQTQTPGYKTV